MRCRGFRTAFFGFEWLATTPRPARSQIVSKKDWHFRRF
jgi:hypothetical protein